MQAYEMLMCDCRSVVYSSDLSTRIVGVSSSTIVPTAVACVMLPPTAPDRLNAKVSTVLIKRSPITVIEIVFVVSPGLNVTVPVAAAQYIGGEQWRERVSQAGEECLGDEECNKKKHMSR